jgi:hypothetical protein
LSIDADYGGSISLNFALKISADQPSITWILSFPEIKIIVEPRSNKLRGFFDPKKVFLFLPAYPAALRRLLRLREAASATAATFTPLWRSGKLWQHATGRARSYEAQAAGSME